MQGAKQTDVSDSISFVVSDNIDFDDSSNFATELGNLDLCTWGAWVEIIGMVDFAIGTLDGGGESGVSTRDALEAELRPL